MTFFATFGINQEVADFRREATPGQNIFCLKGTKNKLLRSLLCHSHKANNINNKKCEFYDILHDRTSITSNYIVLLVFRTGVGKTNTHGLSWNNEWTIPT